MEVFWKAGKSVFQGKNIRGILQRLHDAGVLTLCQADAADAGNLSLTEKENSQQVLANIQYSKLETGCIFAQKIPSLDGG